MQNLNFFNTLSCSCVWFFFHSFPTFENNDLNCVFSFFFSTLHFHEVEVWGKIAHACAHMSVRWCSSTKVTWVFILISVVLFPQNHFDCCTILHTWSSISDVFKRGSLISVKLDFNIKYWNVLTIESSQGYQSDKVRMLVHSKIAETGFLSVFIHQQWLCSWIYSHEIILGSRIVSMVACCCVIVCI